MLWILEYYALRQPFNNVSNYNDHVIYLIGSIYPLDPFVANMAVYTIIIQFAKNFI